NRPPARSGRRRGAPRRGPAGAVGGDAAAGGGPAGAAALVPAELNNRVDKRLRRSFRPTIRPSRRGGILTAVSQENVELVRRALAAFGEGDLEGVLVDLAPDFEFQPSGRFMDTQRVYRGREGMIDFWKTFREAWD